MPAIQRPVDLAPAIFHGREHSRGVTPRVGQLDPPNPWKSACCAPVYPAIGRITCQSVVATSDALAAVGRMESHVQRLDCVAIGPGPAGVRAAENAAARGGQY